MPNFSNISFANPIKFYRYDFLGVHLDDIFAVNQIKSFERLVCYHQKWQVGDQTKIQLKTTIAPQSVKVYTAEGKITATSFAWSLVATGGALGVNLYECTINLDALQVNYNYHLYFECALLSYTAKFISEPIYVKTFHRNTLLFTYKNSYNKLGVYFSTNIEFSFRCEAGLMDYQPELDGSDFVDQIHDISILDAVPYDTFKLYIGEAPGVPNYIVKILNYIFSCDSVRVRRNLTEDGQLFAKQVSEKWEATRVKGFPQFGWATTIQPAINQDSLHFNDNAAPLTPGLVTAYNIDTSLFSTEPVKIAHITEVIKL